MNNRLKEILKPKTKEKILQYIEKLNGIEKFCAIFMFKFNYSKNFSKCNIFDILKDINATSSPST